MESKNHSKKLKVALIFGGKSGEHEVSLVSAVNVFRALDPQKYETTLIGIDKSGRWVVPPTAELLDEKKNPRQFRLDQVQSAVAMIPYQGERSLLATKVDTQVPKEKFDVVIPILHGTYGEDGTIQGLFELADVAYVGSGVVGSSVGMDKDVSRRLLREAGIPVVPTVVLTKAAFSRSAEKSAQDVVAKLGLPFFVKPANMGSSVGVFKVKTAAEAVEKIQDAFRYDVKVLAEKAIDARELECAVLGNWDPKASIVGEIVPTHEFYSYEAKYLDENGAELHVPAQSLSPELAKKIQELSIQAFQVLELKGLARVDFFLDRKTGELFLNEVNTIPGFTSISMYPRLWMASGISYSGLLDELVRLAIERHKEKSALITAFQA